MKAFAVKEKRSAPVIRTSQPSRFGYSGTDVKAQQAEIHHILRCASAQARLTIGNPNGKYEREADHVADQVMAMPEPKLQHRPEKAEKERMTQAKGEGDPTIVSSSIERGINFIRGEVSKLPEPTHANEHLDAEEGILVGLTAAIALNCQPCIRYYLSQAKKAGISEGKVSEVLAKIMAVSANKKRSQTEELLNRHEIQDEGEFWGDT